MRFAVNKDKAYVSHSFSSFLLQPPTSHHHICSFMSQFFCEDHALMARDGLKKRDLLGICSKFYNYYYFNFLDFVIYYLSELFVYLYVAIYVPLLFNNEHVKFITFMCNASATFSLSYLRCSCLQRASYSVDKISYD
jgi:hypothetical protein